jgi:hypothetical protein
MPVTNDSADGEPGVGNSIPTETAYELQALANIGSGLYKKGTLTGEEATALQDAIWTIEYNTGGSTLTVTSADSTINTLAGTYEAYADAHPASYSIGLYPTMYGEGFDYSNGQGFVATPEPSTYAMMGLGFAGFRKARAKAKAAFA